MQGIPPAKDTDAEDVVWGLQTAGSLWSRGELLDAVAWVRRAAQAASDANDDDRAVELARVAADLADWVRAQGIYGGPTGTVPVPRAIEEADDPTPLDANPSRAPLPEPPAVVDEEHSESVLPAEKVHAGIFDPWAEQPPVAGPSRAAASARPGIPSVFVADEEEVITSVQVQSIPPAARPSAPAPAASTSAAPKAPAPPKPPPVPAGPPRKPPPLPPRASQTKLAKPPLPPAAAGAGPRPAAPETPPGAPQAAAPPPPPDVALPAPTGASSARPAPVASPSPPSAPTAVPDPARPLEPADLGPPPSVPWLLSPSAIPPAPVSPAPASPTEQHAQPPVAAISREAPLLDLEGLDAFADLPDDARAAFAAAARVDVLAEGEEVSAFALAYVIEGAVDVAATMVDAAAVRLATGSVLRSRGSTNEAVPMRLIAVTPRVVVATWSDADVEQAFRTCPWVEEDLRAASDRVMTLVGITIGPLGERLDQSIREQIVGRLTVRPLLAGELVVKKGDPVPGLFLVGVGEIELVDDDGSVQGIVGSGDFLFAREVLGGGASPRTARAGAGGALIFFGDRHIAQELMVTCPPLLEVFAGM